MRQDCAIYLQFGGKFRLPVNPEEIELTRPTDHETYDVMGLGEIVVPKRPSLQEIGWESFFPGDRSAPYVNTGARSAKRYVKQLEQAMKNKTVGRVIVTRSGGYDTNLRCVITEFSTKDKGGEPSDLYYSIKFQEYRPYAPQTIAVVTQANEQAAPEVSAGEEAERAVETPVLRVGASVIANGKYWYDSYGAKPFGTANNLQTTVTRIVSVDGRAYPVHIGQYGWIKADQLQIVG